MTKIKFYMKFQDVKNFKKSGIVEDFIDYLIF